MTNKKYTKHLVGETSPYYLQHMRNPIDWYQWNDDTLPENLGDRKLLWMITAYIAAVQHACQS